MWGPTAVGVKFLRLEDWGSWGDAGKIYSCGSADCWINTGFRPSKTWGESLFLRTGVVIPGFDFREQRVTGVIVFILTGISVFMAPILKVRIQIYFLPVLIRHQTLAKNKQ